MVVKADGKVIKDGAWRWNSGTEVMFRPESYWPGNSKITLESNFKGVHISKSVWGKTDSVNTWHTGPAMISYVNLQTHMMKVTRNGKTIRNIPIAAGKPGFDTRSGIKVILTKERTRRMDAATGGTPQDSPEYYDLVVEYAMRVTWSGEFLHAAPWSVGNQGVYNSSHGCTGMSTANAEWLYNESEIGDVVVFTGSDRHMTMDNGIGDWNVPLDRWAAGYDS
jgi:lipoprotein-anchoring transpeptidase ErfK/SrfK